MISRNNPPVDSDRQLLCIRYDRTTRSRGFSPFPVRWMKQAFSEATDSPSYHSLYPPGPGDREELVMRIKAIFAAIGIAVAAFGMTGTAEARDRWDDRRGYDRQWDNGRHWNNDRRWKNDRHWKHDRRYYRDSSWDRRHHGRNDRCWNEWRRNHRVRVCR